MTKCHGAVGKGGTTVQLMYLNQNNLIPRFVFIHVFPVSMCSVLTTRHWSVMFSDCVIGT